MAVDQLRNLNLFREMLSTSNNYSNTNNNINPINNNNNNNMMLYSSNNNSNITNPLPLPMMNVDSSLVQLPFYNLNDVVFNSGAVKLAPAVKDDSGVTFIDNSLVHVNLQPAMTSRKRARESTAVLPAVMVSGGGSSSAAVSKEARGFSFLGEDLSLQIMQHHLELDRLVSQHMEKMRMEMEERKKQQLIRMMASIEDAMVKKMREKEVEISKLLKNNWELQDKVKTLYLQTQIWRDAAQTNEATANALRSNLEQVLHENDAVRTARELADDAVSCCGSSGYEEEEEEEEEESSGERWVKRRRNCNEGERWVYRGKKEGGESESQSKSKKMLCKKCGEGESRVLVLPCRHLCLCTLCGPRVNACPICESAKSASIHVNLS